MRITFEVYPITAESMPPRDRDGVYGLDIEAGQWVSLAWSSVESGWYTTAQFWRVCSRYSDDDMMQTFSHWAEIPAPSAADQDVVVKALVAAKEALWVWTTQYAPEYCDEADVEQNEKILKEGGGTLHYQCLINKALDDAIASLQSIPLAPYETPEPGGGA